MNPLILTREQLYEQIWSKSLSAVAAGCQISIPVLRQLCLEEDIPLPWGGYLPSKVVTERPALPVKTGFDLPAAIAAARNGLHFPGETSASFSVSTKLTDPDKLILAAQGTIDQDFQLWGMPQMLRAGLGQLAIRSSKSNMDRALRIMDTLVKAWRHRGYRISNQERETHIHLREVSIRVSLREITKALPQKDKYGSRLYEPTGCLAFRVDGWIDREWKDGKVPLESHIQEILDHMEVTARDLEKTWAKRRAEEQQRALEQQAEADRVKASAAESAAFEALVQEAQRWHQLQVLEQYLDALRKNTPPSPAFQQWLQWAWHRRQLFDPITERAPKF